MGEVVDVDEENCEESSLSWVRRRGSCDVMDLVVVSINSRQETRLAVLIRCVLDLRFERLDTRAQLF